MIKKLSIIVLSIIMFFGVSAIPIYASDNPVTLVYYEGAGTYTFSEDGLTADMKGFVHLVVSERKTEGKWYWESTIGENLDGSFGLHLYAEDELPIMRRAYLNDNRVNTFHMGIYNGSARNYDPVDIKGKAGDIIGIAFDGDNGILDFYHNGVKFYTFDDLEGYTSFLPAFSCLSDPRSTHIVTVNFGRSPFAYEIPQGYLPYDRGSTANSGLRILLAVDEQAQLSLSNRLLDNSQVSWSSSNLTAASVSLANGIVSAIAAGETTITASNSDGTYIDTIRIKVVEQFDDEQWRLAYDLNAGESGRLYLDSDALINWSSMNPGVASIEQNGHITAVSPGLAIIQAEHKGYSEIIYIRVR